MPAGLEVYDTGTEQAKADCALKLQLQERSGERRMSAAKVNLQLEAIWSRWYTMLLHRVER